MDDDLPDCPNCGQKMRLAASSPLKMIFPVCKGLGAIIAVEVTRGRGITGCAVQRLR